MRTTTVTVTVHNTEEGVLHIALLVLSEKYLFKYYECTLFEYRKYCLVHGSQHQLLVSCFLGIFVSSVLERSVRRLRPFVDWRKKRTACNG